MVWIRKLGSHTFREIQLHNHNIGSPLAKMSAKIPKSGCQNFKEPSFSPIFIPTFIQATSYLFFESVKEGGGDFYISSYYIIIYYILYIISFESVKEAVIFILVYINPKVKNTIQTLTLASWPPNSRPPAGSRHSSPERGTAQCWSPSSILICKDNLYNAI